MIRARRKTRKAFEFCSSEKLKNILFIEISISQRIGLEESLKCYVKIDQIVANEREAKKISERRRFLGNFRNFDRSTSLKSR